MRSNLKICIGLLILLLICASCSFQDIREKARHIKYSEIVENFEDYNGELIKVEGIVWMPENFKPGDDIILVGVEDDEYYLYFIQNTLGYKAYKGEFLTIYGKINAIAKNAILYDLKPVRIEPKIIEQTKEPREELKNDEFLKMIIEDIKKEIYEKEE